MADDKRRTILGAKAPAPYLPNISLEAIERFREQIAIVNLISEDDPRQGMNPENVKKAVWSCIQERLVEFMGYRLYDPGAWPEPPICQKISMKVTEPWRPELSEKEKEVIERIKKGLSTEAQKKHVDEEEEERRRKDSETLLELLGLKKKKES